MKFSTIKTLKKSENIICDNMVFCMSTCYYLFLTRNVYINSCILSKSILIGFTFGLQTNMLILYMHSIYSVHSSSSGCFYYWKRRLRNPKQCSFCAKTRAENQYLTRDELSLSLQLVPSFTIVRIGEFCPRMKSSFLDVMPERIYKSHYGNGVLAMFTSQCRPAER